MSALYVVAETRTDGRWRKLFESSDPEACLAQMTLLRWAGSPARVLLASEIEADLWSQDSDVPIAPRSAVNWFLDAATYARDGEVDLAIEAAESGIAALRESE